jgi:TolB protein
LSGEEELSAAHPVWSPDGQFLAWGGVTTKGLHHIYLWDSQSPEPSPANICSGDWAAWSPDGKALLVVFDTPYESYLTAYPIAEAPGILLPPLKLPGMVSGLVWANISLSGELVQLNPVTPTALWQVDSQDGEAAFEDRWDLVEMEDVAAPYPRLHVRAEESFQSLRAKLATLVGWDLLADLENAFLPLSSALPPGLLDDWLYTGRAFAINTLPINAGWMVVVREDFGPETYWRVYLRARFQDGSQGRPLNRLPWDFNARYSGVPQLYEQGGALAAITPGGYWVDMTQVAAAYGWERLAALSTWRAAYPSARFNEFAFREGLTWESAMLQIYPPEVLLTLTPLPTATASTTPAPLWYRSPTPTVTSSLAVTSTPLATPTPAPSSTTTQAVPQSPSPTVEPGPTLAPTGTNTTVP